MELLLLLTVLVLFSTTWLALYLAKLVTRPVVALAEATQEISRGRLDYRVEVSAADEIGDLVRSFNRMAEELEPAAARSKPPATTWARPTSRWNSAASTSRPFWRAFPPECFRWMPIAGLPTSTML